jgi:lysozyme
MDISQRGLDLIKDYESYSAEAYLCPENVPTIGWGSIRWSAGRPVKLGDTCTVEQAEGLLRREVEAVEDAIELAVPDARTVLTQGQFDCLVSWGYNVGTGWINGKRKGGAATLMRYINAGQLDKVPGELVKFKKGAVSGKSYNGLLNRRKRELKELWFADDADLKQPVSAAAKVPDEEPEKSPQAVEPERKTVTEAIGQSGTAKTSLFGLISGGALWTWQWVGGVAQQASLDTVSTQQSVSGLSALFAYLNVSAIEVAGLIAIGCLVVALLRAIERGR